MSRSINWVTAILIASVFLVAGLWKLSDPAGAAVRLAQARVPEAFSLSVAFLLAIAETLAGAMLLVAHLRRWGAVLASLLLVAFMIFVGIHYSELRGADCSCFPWVKRAVGPAFFAADGVMLLLAIVAGWGSRRPTGARGALVLLILLAASTGVSYRLNAARHRGTQAPESITAEDGRPISLRQGKVFLYFFDPQCLHCLEAGRRLAALDWAGTRFIGVPTANPQFAGWFMGKAGLLAKGPVSRDLVALKKAFPFDLPPAGVALEDGYEKAMLLRFEDKEPRAALETLGFAHAR
ncbi:MAG: hypothetical protein M3N54_10480 [Acidobacteriota bacterium]|nr:hypothetical protein [Acidobacteriota bacterium]